MVLHTVILIFIPRTGNTKTNPRAVLNLTASQLLPQAGQDAVPDRGATEGEADPSALKKAFLSPRPLPGPCAPTLNTCQTTVCVLCPPPGRAMLSFRHSGTWPIRGQQAAGLQEGLTDHGGKTRHPRNQSPQDPPGSLCTTYVGGRKLTQICFQPKRNQWQRNKLATYFTFCPP